MSERLMPDYLLFHQREHARGRERGGLVEAAIRAEEGKKNE